MVLDESVVQLLWQMGDQFLNETIEFAAKLAVIRDGTAIDVRDVGLALDRLWDMQLTEAKVTGAEGSPTELKRDQKRRKVNFL